MGQPPQPTVEEARSSSESLKSPRTARFAEATAVHSPVDENSRRSPFTDPQPQGNVGDVGFGYVATNDPAQHANDSRPPASPLKSALRVPGTARTLDIRSPTFREEYMLEKQEKVTEKANEKDLKIKLRVRIAKIFLRFVNFGCSLIVLSLLAVTLSIFNATKTIEARNSLPAWAEGTNPWAQYMLLGMACLSLTAVYYTTFTVCFFVFSLIMWIVGAAVYAHSKTTTNGQDMWSWSCAHNNREQDFSNVVDYALLCRLQDWGLLCAIIEIVIEVLVILIYAVVAYRVWSKRKLMKTMDQRDRARSDLYLAQLRLQSAPNTPGFPGFSPYPPKSPFIYSAQLDPYSVAEKGEYHNPATQYASPRSPTRPAPTFQLQAPPIKVQGASPQMGQGEFAPSNQSRTPSPPSSQHSSQHSGPVSQPSVSHHSAAAGPNEPSYGSVPIPGAYS
ncbi:hypothetical protein N7474_002931 [Penicillium riverlandense]|uniref:uncharacterized protein n=1 Tax=Penicillium riverlandense TaxID=1903569 RepID=UPI002547962D|nr:uncharacterized protein N7474_002931 [Penicillium riverlandense]KAJ5825793.1 hypothetical protein N7474_002931 [Penicillium riverlandense]